LVLLVAAVNLSEWVIGVVRANGAVVEAVVFVLVGVGSVLAGVEATVCDFIVEVANAEVSAFAP